MSNCNACGSPISWDGWVKGNPPNNPDGTPHDCPNKKSGGKQSTFPAADPAKVLEECQAFHNTFGDLDAARFESLAKIYISRMMRK